MQTTRIIVTSSAGDKLAEKPNIGFSTRPVQAHFIELFPEHIKQTMTGLGTSFTQASAFVLAHLELEQRAVVMQKIYGTEGANFSLARTHIGACDFCVEGHYSYAETPGDKTLEKFSIEVDRQGFNSPEYRNIIDSSFALLPMIKQANAIKKNQGDEAIKIIASAWTAPTWMKDIGSWYQRATPENGMHGTGGELIPEYVQTYADYLIKYVAAYHEEGVPIWALTPVNEPVGNNGQWESMHFTPESQRDFIKAHLGPTIEQSEFNDLKLLIYDQNRDHLEEWADTILGDSAAANYVYGTAIHWYESTYQVNEDALDRVQDAFPGFDIIHTEGCIDDLGKPAPAGVLDPEGFQESGWFDNDEFWWSCRASDWAYTATWAPRVEDHPMYTPVHRYARNIIVSINHWVSGWIDWNIVLDEQGGPNHVGNFCGAPIMINTSTKQVYFTPIFYVLSQLSRTIRPGDKAIGITPTLPDLDKDALHACATINTERLVSVQLLNTTDSEIMLDLKIADKVAGLKVPANAVMTVVIQL